MIDISSVALSVITTVLSGAVVGYVITKLSFRKMETVISAQKLLLKKEAQEWLNSETGQKALYMIGGLIAAGAKGGLIGQTPRGKGGFQGMIMDLIGNFIGNKISPGTALQPQQQQPQNPQW